MPGGAWLPRHAPRAILAFPAAERAACLRAVETRVPQAPDLVEGGVAPLAVLDAARRSAQEGRVVEVAP